MNKKENHDAVVYLRFFVTDVSRCNDLIRSILSNVAISNNDKFEIIRIINEFLSFKQRFFQEFTMKYED